MESIYNEGYITGITMVSRLGAAPGVKLLNLIRFSDFQMEADLCGATMHHLLSVCTFIILQCTQKVKGVSILFLRD